MKIVFALLLWPFRLIMRLLLGRSVSTVRKAGGSAIGREGALDAVTVEETSEVPRPSQTFPFKTIDRPRLAETSATEMTLEVAEALMPHARRFYDHEFNLFPSESLFYEEIEAEELSYALGSDDPTSTDMRFVLWIDLFRRTLNDNVRRLFVIYTPLVFLAMLGLVAFITSVVPVIEGVPGFEGAAFSSLYLSIPLAMAFGLLSLVVTYQWPFKVILQKNTLGLDNYITSRFSRINQNFQVAKRFALNVERNKRMAQAKELRHEAGVWTVAYHWLAMRLFLCERLVRNKMYQVNRNATLYRVGGIFICIGILAAVLTATTFVDGEGIDREALILSSIGGLLFIFLAYSLVMGSAATAASAALRDNEWFRFGGADLDRTIADHVAEDRLQIVTFRDRNRME